ncbi:O-methyltransferase asqD [Paramyrothecium foliicola]|nr:O-methyltransferase asqD [Paramyrothecium foliicola]
MGSHDVGTVESYIEELRRLQSQGDLERDTKARQNALAVARKLTRSLEQPEYIAGEMIFAQFVPTAARIAVEMNIFTHMVEKQGPITSQELASLCPGEEQLIVRILRVLSSSGIVNEVGERTWEASPVTAAMATEGIAAGYRMVGEMVMAAAQMGPKYLKEVGYVAPTDPNDGFMQYAFQTKLSSFDLIASKPSVFKDFNTFMGRKVGAKTKWLEWYPVQERLIKDARQDTPLLVDIGGGNGHDVIAFQELYPDAGQLILQDQASVIASIQNMPTGIDRMAYDFFTPQPVKGARVYYFHHIFHDWSDFKSLEILEQVVAAMTPGYSKLLIHDIIVPEVGALQYHASLDMTMMCFNGGMERTARQWRELLRKAGLDILEIWPAPEDGAGGMVEAMLIK